MTIKSTVLGPGNLKIGETGTQREFAAQLTKCKLTPNVDTDEDVYTLSGETLEGEDTITWEISGTMLQDYQVASLEDFCFTNASLKLPFVFTPRNTTAYRQYTGILKIRPIEVGGDIKKRNTSDFTFPVIGTPTPGVVA